VERLWHPGADRASAGVPHGAELAARLLDIVRNGSDADALRAIEALNSRVLGRPTERVEVDAAERPRTMDELRKLTHEQRQALLLELERGGELAQHLPNLLKPAPLQG
jgi:hypothetical protein